MINKNIKNLRKKIDDIDIATVLTPDEVIKNPAVEKAYLGE